MAKKDNRKRRTFRTGVAPSDSVNDPESLFRDLKRRSPDIPFLWAHQADILRAYADRYESCSDVALELPTGTGKTLIGLLLAEYRRLKYKERVLYLCPTRQLAHQVGNHAKEYGIPAIVLLPPDYSELPSYSLGKSIGIATYSGLFNTNPKITEPNAIICDDAHSSENYIAGLWSLSIRREKQETLYKALISILSVDLDEAFVEILTDDSPRPSDRSNIDSVPHPLFHRKLSAIRSLITENVADYSSEWFAWSMIRDNLHACLAYVSWSEILFRPLIPPTGTHAHFAEARQRILMSATLGEGGELERVTGLPRIERIPVPKGWDKQGSGRRLFLFPNFSLAGEEINKTMISALKACGKALVLVPSQADVASFADLAESGDITPLGSAAIEDSMDAFVNEDPPAVLVLAGRYDGLDLPGDSCRLLILNGLPAGANLQESFYLTRLRATSLLRDRLRTRFTQGVGRCCRGSSDYCIVMVVGQRLFDFCARVEVRKSLHPELQAEIQFGLENSDDLSSDDCLDLIEVFLSQADDWEEAEKAIKDIRDTCERESDPVAEILLQVSGNEVRFVRSLWKKDYEGALERAIGITDRLDASGLDGYRAWWYYLGGVASWLHYSETGRAEFSAKAKNLFKRASKASTSISWFSRLFALMESDDLPEADVASDSVETYERALRVLSDLGFHGRKFERRWNELTEDLSQTKSKRFQRGLKSLGDMLGYDTRNPDDQGAPDGVWFLSKEDIIAFEAKSDESPEGPISLKTVRQANTHEKWVRTELGVGENASVRTVILSPRQWMDKGAQKRAEKLYYLHTEEMTEIAENVRDAMRSIRAQLVEGSEASGLDTIQRELSRAALLPSDVLNSLLSVPVTEMPIK